VRRLARRLLERFAVWEPPRGAKWIDRDGR
jgi:hypothetical protein